jgi:hypothetical protein
MDYINMPPPKKPDLEPERGGTRGGMENFQWDSLKVQSKREQQHYLGVSSKLGSSALTKISKPTISKSSTKLAEERKAAKVLEEKAMRRALGLVDSKKPTSSLAVKKEQT